MIKIFIKIYILCAFILLAVILYKNNEYSEIGAKGGKAGSIESKAKAGRLSKGGGRPNKKALLPQVLELKAQGYNNRAIAEDLGIGSATVSRWLKQI